MLMDQRGMSSGIDATLLCLTSEEYGKIESWRSCRSWCTWYPSGKLNLPIVQCETTLFATVANLYTSKSKLHSDLLSMQYCTWSHKVIIEILTTPRVERSWCTWCRHRMDEEAREATLEKVGRLLDILEDIQVGLAQKFEIEHLKSLAASEYDAIEVIKAGTFQQFQNAGLPKTQAQLIIEACRSDPGTHSPCHCACKRRSEWKSDSYFALLHVLSAVFVSPYASFKRTKTTVKSWQMRLSWNINLGTPTLTMTSWQPLMKLIYKIPGCFAPGAYRPRHALFNA